MEGLAILGYLVGLCVVGWLCENYTPLVILSGILLIVVIL